MFCFVFNTTTKQSLLSLFQNNNKDKKFIVPSFCSFCFLNGLFTHALAKCADRIIILNIDQISLCCAVIATWLVTSGIIQLYWHLTFEFLDIRGHCRYFNTLYTRSVKQRRRRWASWNKIKLKQNRKRQINNLIKSK